MGRPERRPSSIAVDVALDAVDDHFERDQILAALEHDEISIFFARLNELLVHGLDRCKILAKHGIEASPALCNVAADAARSGGTIVTQEGSLYPVLYKLQDQGMISGEKVLVGKRMTRVYYHLEEPGRRRLQELVHEYQVMTRGVFQIIQRETDAKEGG